MFILLVEIAVPNISLELKSLPFEIILKVFVSLLPVLAFLLVLIHLDTHKLIGSLFTLSCLLVGCILGILSLYINSHLMETFAMTHREYSYYAAPAMEELIKGTVILYLIATKRVGFLVDSIILGFAVGSGFAIIENLYYFFNNPEIHLGVWIIRGFGTAIMHGGATAIFALIIQEKFIRHTRLKFLNLGLAFIGAFSLHVIFNHYPASILMSVAVPLVILPALFFYVINKNTKSIDAYLSHDFEKQRQLLTIINHPETADDNNSEVGQFIHDIKANYSADVSQDLIAYTKLHIELVLSAEKLLGNVNGASGDPVDNDIERKIREMHQLEHKIGKTAFYFIKEHLHFNSKDFWMIHRLDELALDHKMKID